jgi:superfamily I DNA and/or RNA helicase
MLTVQYRMNSTICDWSSNFLYHGRVHSADSVHAHTLLDLPYPTAISSLPPSIDPSLLSTPLLLLDTAGCDMNEDSLGIASS